MEGSVARSVLSSVFTNAFAGGSDRIASGTETKKAKDEYTNEPTMWDRFVCFLSGFSYTGGSYFDGDGECRVKGELIERNPHGR